MRLHEVDPPGGSVVVWSRSLPCARRRSNRARAKPPATIELGGISLRDCVCLTVSVSAASDNACVRAWVGDVGIPNRAEPFKRDALPTTRQKMLLRRVARHFGVVYKDQTMATVRAAVAAAWDTAGAGDTVELPAVTDAKEEEP